MTVMTDTLRVRCLPEVVESVDKAAAAKLMKPSEYVRRAVIDRLQADGVDPARSNRTAGDS
ncbi:hypothetical protein ACQPTN_24835 [Bradyrhizobium sp. 13971]